MAKSESGQGRELGPSPNTEHVNPAITGVYATSSSVSSPSSKAEAIGPASKPDLAGGAVAESSAAFPTSFSHIVDLIKTDAPIPGVKEIPNTVLEGQGSRSVEQQRKKPWEMQKEG